MMDFDAIARAIVAEPRNVIDSDLRQAIREALEEAYNKGLDRAVLFIEEVRSSSRLKLTKDVLGVISESLPQLKERTPNEI